MVIDHYVIRNPPPTSSSFQLIKAQRNVRINQLNMQLNQVSNELEMEKKQGEDLDQIMKASRTRCWWEASIEELDLSQLEVLKMALEDLKSKVTQQAEQLLTPSSNPPQYFTPDSFGGVPNFEPDNSGFNTNMVSYGYDHVGHPLLYI